jgi:hypothetical protein
MCPEIIKECEELAHNEELDYEDTFGTKAKQMNPVQLLQRLWRLERDRLTKLLTSAQSRCDSYYYLNNYIYYVKVGWTPFLLIYPLDTFILHNIPISYGFMNKYCTSLLIKTLSSFLF